MLNTPKNGWAGIHIGKWEDRCSYIDNVPNVLLDGMIRSCREHKPVAMKFDAEGYDYIIVVDWVATYIIYSISDFVAFLQNDSAPGMESAGFAYEIINRDVLAKELVRDITENLDDWARFYCSIETMEDAEKEKTVLQEKCEELLSLLPSDDLKLIFGEPSDDFRQILEEGEKE